MWQQPGFAITDVIGREEYGYRHSYAALIACRLGYDLHNHAIPGGSNDAVYRIFCSLAIGPQDIVIACWTGPDRTEIWSDHDQTWIAIRHGQCGPYVTMANPVAKQGLASGAVWSQHQAFDQYAKQWTMHEVNEHRGKLNRAKNIAALNHAARARGIRVLNFHSFAAEHTDHYDCWPVTQSFCDWCKQRQFAMSKGGHFFADAHSAFADMAMQSLTTKL